MGKSILNINGDYSIIKRLGTGARSTIYLATDLADKSKREVALKRVIYERPEDTRVFEQVESEYKIAKQLDHPYIRKCYKMTKVRTMLRVREVLLSMEHFEGQSLEEGPTLSLVDVMLVFRMVAGGLHAMHQQGFVHCDIKPNNILFNRSGAIKIIDLGQSCKIGTIKQRIQGTPDYIAPEQVKRKALGPKTDIFNLGATMYWALTGENVPTLIPKEKNAIGLHERPPKCRSPHQIKAAIPLPLSELIMECVKFDPVERPTNMTHIISRLDQLIHALLESRKTGNKDVASHS